MSDHNKRIFTLPNALSLFRLLASPCLIYLALKNNPSTFLILLLLSLLTDLFDGCIARFSNTTSEVGAKLDSLADFVLAISVVPGIWKLWPELVENEGVFFILVIVNNMVQVLCGYVKFGKAPSYHTWASKAATTMLGGSVLLLLYTESLNWPFRVAVFFHLAATVESIMITLVLHRWKYNVPSLWHALRYRKKK